MGYKVLVSKQAQKAYGRLSGKMQAGVDRCLDVLSTSPTFDPDIKKLQGQENAYRYRVGGWRVIYHVYEDAKTVVVANIAPRGDVYKH